MIGITSSYYRIVFYILASLLGLCVGSFLNVVIYRLPLKMSLASPPSHCPKCGYQLKFYDNIPLLSYIFLGGRCRKCKTHIPFRYTAVELSNMLLWLLSAYLFVDNVVYACLMAAVSSLCICVFFIDLEHMIIFDRFQISLLIIGIIALFFDRDYSILSHIIGFFLGLIFFLLMALVMGKILKKEALGGGDVKFAAVSGLLLGWERFILMILIASVSASIVLLIQRKKEGESKEHPFAPYLVVGLLFSLFFGSKLLRLYFSLILG